MIAEARSLGARIRALRRRNGLRVRDLAARSGISHATISRLETGAAGEIRSEGLRRLALELGVSTDYLLGLSRVRRVPNVVENKDVLRVLTELDTATPSTEDGFGLSWDLVRLVDYWEHRDEYERVIAPLRLQHGKDEPEDVRQIIRAVLDGDTETLQAIAGGSTGHSEANRETARGFLEGLQAKVEPRPRTRRGRSKEKGGTGE